MRKLLKTLFSQLVIVSFLLILQLFLMAASILRMSEYFLYFDIFLKLVSLVAVLIIINRHSNPTYKLAWVIPILFFPLFGGLFYLFITGQMHTKRFFRTLSSLETEITEKFPQDTSIISEIEKTHAERVNTVQFIKNISGRNVYRSCDSRYFPSGEEMFEDMLENLKSAQKYIFLEYFIIKEGKMWNSILEILKEKASEGVDVRVMYDGMGSMTLLPHSYPKTLAKYGIKCHIFSRFTPFLSALQNNRDHRKILVIDGKLAYTGGINLSDEYINIDYPQGHWKDMGVSLRGDAAFSFTMMFLELWWHCTGKKEDIENFVPPYSEKDLSLMKEQSSGYVMPFSDVPQEGYQTGEFIYLDIINKAKKYVYITTPYLILDNEMVVALTNAAKSGVDVRIICPRATDHWYARSVAYSYYRELTESGVKLYEYTPGFIHGKTFCSDDNVCVIGSINLDYRSLYLHFECAAWFLDAPVAETLLSDFRDTVKKCRRITTHDWTKMPAIKKFISASLRLFAPLM